MEQVVAGNPDYAPAWAALGQAYGQWPFYNPAARYGPLEELQRFGAAYFPKAEAAAQRAIQLDPDLADGYLALGLAQGAHGPILATEALWSKALSLDPTNPEGLELYGYLLASVGRLKESLAAFQRLQELEPFVPAFNLNAALIRWEAGQTDAAIAVLKEMKGGQVARSLAFIYASLGRYGEAADLLQANAGGAPPEIQAEAVRLVRAAPAKTPSPQTLHLGVLGFAYLYVGAPERVLEWYEGNVGAGARNFYDISMMWHPSYAAVRKTDRFKAFMRKAGYVDYWRAKGWPEFCHPTTGDDFECN